MSTHHQRDNYACFPPCRTSKSLSASVIRHSQHSRSATSEKHPILQETHTDILGTILPKFKHCCESFGCWPGRPMAGCNLLSLFCIHSFQLSFKFLVNLIKATKRYSTLPLPGKCPLPKFPGFVSHINQNLVSTCRFQLAHRV